MRTGSILSLLALCTLLFGCGQKSEPLPPPTAESIAAFTEAAFNGNTLVVTEALKNGMPANQTNAEGFCALMAASFNGHVETIQALIDAGANVNQTNTQGVTPLIAACGPYPAAVRLLLENGAEVNAADKIESFTALMYAAVEGLSPVCDILLEYGADPSMKDDDKDTAATHAKTGGHLALADKLQKLIDEK